MSVQKLLNPGRGVVQDTTPWTLRETAETEVDNWCSDGMTDESTEGVTSYVGQHVEVQVNEYGYCICIWMQNHERQT